MYDSEYVWTEWIKNIPWVKISLLGQLNQNDTEVKIWPKWISL